MELLLIRHGQTAWNKERRCQGFTDIPLNDEGVRQAEALALSLKGRKLKGVYSSTLKRAYETAARVARYHGLEVAADEGLRELNHGDLEGLTQEEILLRHSDLMIRWRQDAASVCMPGGESLEDLRLRAWPSIERIIENHPGQEVAVVGHNLTNLVIICHAMGMELSDFRKFSQDQSAVNIISFSDGNFSFQALNDTSHLKV